MTQANMSKGRKRLLIPPDVKREGERESWKSLDLIRLLGGGKLTSQPSSRAHSTSSSQKKVLKFFTLHQATYSMRIVVGSAYFESGFRFRITLMRIQTQLFTEMWIRIRIQLFILKWIWFRILRIIKVMRICDHWSTDPPGIHFEPPRLHCERPLPSTIPFSACETPAFHSNADPDPDPASKNKSDPCGQGFGSGSALIWVAGSGSAFKLRNRIRIQEGKNDPQK